MKLSREQVQALLNTELGPLDPNFLAIEEQNVTAPVANAHPNMANIPADDVSSALDIVVRELVRHFDNNQHNEFTLTYNSLLQLHESDEIQAALLDTGCDCSEWIPDGPT